jgi:hypothetical protein
MSTLTSYDDFYNPYITYLNSELQMLLRINEPEANRRAMIRTISTFILISNMMREPHHAVTTSIMGLTRMLSQWEQTLGLATPIWNRQVSFFKTPPTRMLHPAYPSLPPSYGQAQKLGGAFNALAKATMEQHLNLFTDNAPKPTPTGITRVLCDGSKLITENLEWRKDMKISYPDEYIILVNWEDITLEAATAITEIWDRRKAEYDALDAYNGESQAAYFGRHERASPTENWIGME